MTLRVFMAVVLQAGLSLAAASFGPAKNYPNIGLMFPCLVHAKADPVPMPDACAYVSVLDDELSREDRFEPSELWYAHECCARWSDPAGLRLVIARMTTRLPLFTEELVSRKRFAAALADSDNRFDPKNKDHVNEWVATFSDAAVYPPETVKINSFNLDEVLYFPSAASNIVIYAFRPRRVGNAKNSDWFCATLQTPQAADLQNLRELFEDEFVSKIGTAGRASEDEGSEAEEVSADDQNDTPIDQPDNPVRLEARKSIANYDTWWYAETQGYIILSDADTAVGKSVIRDLQRMMPAMHKAYAKLVPPLTHEEDVSVIRMFQTRDDYTRYVGKDQAWTAAVWMPNRRELVLVQDGSNEEIMKTIRHEAFHQYLSYAYCLIPPAPWMNEGHACLFENASLGKKEKVTLNEDVARTSMLVENIDLAVALIPKLLEMDYDAFYDGNSTERNMKYALAWGLAYYLQKGAPQERNTPFKDILPNYTASLFETRSYTDATKKAFEPVDMNVFQANFREFWLKRRASALSFDPLDD